MTKLQQDPPINMLNDFPTEMQQGLPTKMQKISQQNATISLKSNKDVCSRNETEKMKVLSSVILERRRELVDCRSTLGEHVQNTIVLQES